MESPVTVPAWAYQAPSNPASCHQRGGAMSQLALTQPQLRIALLTWECVSRAGYLRPTAEARQQSAEQVADESSAFLWVLLQGLVGQAADHPSAASGPLPRIGEAWPGMGGRFAGLVRGDDGAPDQALILADAKPAGALAWQPALDWAATVEADGHHDFTLPTRAESALLYANLQAILSPTWHWTSEPGGASYAWYCHFYNGTQTYRYRSAEGSAVAVRRLTA